MTAKTNGMDGRLWLPGGERRARIESVGFNGGLRSIRDPKARTQLAAYLDALRGLERTAVDASRFPKVPSVEGVQVSYIDSPDFVTMYVEVNSRRRPVADREPVLSCVTLAEVHYKGIAGPRGYAALD